MTDVVLRGRLDGGFEHLSIGFSDEGDGSGRGEKGRRVSKEKRKKEVRERGRKGELTVPSFQLEQFDRLDERRRRVGQACRS